MHAVWYNRRCPGSLLRASNVWKRGFMRLRDWWKDQSAKDRAAYIGGILALVAAIISGTSAVTAAIINANASARDFLYTSPSSAGPTYQPAPTATITRLVTVGPSADASTSATPQTTPQSNLKPTPHAIPLLSPIINQHGWALAWHQNVSIDPQGIILGSSGPQIGDGNEYDLQYISGNDNGWDCRGSVNVLDYWSYTSRPGPATINGIVGNWIGCARGKQAHVGDRMYVTIATGGRFNANRIAYMQVVRVDSGDIVADMWVWNAS